jgi:hypothetical protein
MNQGHSPQEGRAMSAQDLLRWVERPEVHRQIVGDYEGGYALGVTDNPPAFVLRVGAEDVGSFPNHVTVQGVEVPVVVQGNFKPPRPLTSRH